jgi:hypothetical protein
LLLASATDSQLRFSVADHGRESVHLQSRLFQPSRLTHLTHDPKKAPVWAWPYLKQLEEHKGLIGVYSSPATEAHSV